MNKRVEKEEDAEWDWRERGSERGSESGSERGSERGRERSSAKMLMRTENQIFLFCKRIVTSWGKKTRNLVLKKYKKRKEFENFFLKKYPITYRKMKFHEDVRTCRWLQLSVFQSYPSPLGNSFFFHDKSWN